MKLFIILVLCVAPEILYPANADTLLQQVVVFEPGNGYASTRIPALVITQKGTLLAFAAGRIESGSDWADMDLLLKRSEDEGKTWSALQVLVSKAGGKPVDNPTPIVGSDGTIHLLYQRDYAYVYYTQSTDDGFTWSVPVNITSTLAAFKREYDWKVVAPGPGHSIELGNGRLIVPVWMANSDKISPHRSHRPSRIATIYSDDNGKTWNRGSLVPAAAGFKNPSETMAVELPDGRVMLSIRNESDKRRKGVSYSSDGISGWTSPTYDDGLFEPICMSGIIKARSNGMDYLLFVNPDSENMAKHPRQNLMVKLSKDNGDTWPIKKVLYNGDTGYADLAVSAGGTIYCLYETRRNGMSGYSLVLQSLSLKHLLDQ